MMRNATRYKERIKSNALHIKSFFHSEWFFFFTNNDWVFFNSDVTVIKQDRKM